MFLNCKNNHTLLFLFPVFGLLCVFLPLFLSRPTLCYLHSGDQLLLLTIQLLFLTGKQEVSSVPAPYFCFLLCCGSHLHLAWCHKSSPLQGPMWQMWKAGDSRQLCTSLKAVPSPMSAQGQGVSFPHVAGHVAHSFTPSYPLRDCSFPAAIQ